MIAQWTATGQNGKSSEELLLKFDRNRSCRVLILPALFDEANKLRRFTVQLMRQLDALEIDSFLPDLPGCNESLEPLAEQTLVKWRDNAREAAKQVSASHVLTIRGGAMLAEIDLPGWRYASLAGAKQMRSMERAQKLAERETRNGSDTSSQERSETSGSIVLNGWEFGAELIEALRSEPLPERVQQSEIPQSTLTGAGLWLRAEPDEDQSQSLALAEIIAADLACQ